MHTHHATPQTRQWLRFDDKARHSYVTADKHKLVAQLGIPYRDLRILDPPVLAQATAAILIREKALVVNMECVRMIICKDQVLLLTVPTAGVQSSLQGVTPTWDCPFARDLQARLFSVETNTKDLLTMEKQQPYELHALEAALFSTVRIFDSETADLEAKAGPSLERLTQQVSNRELETVRNIKSALNKLVDRVSKVKQVLEDILDDDADMHDMYLARREQISEEREERNVTRQATCENEAAFADLLTPVPEASPAFSAAVEQPYPEQQPYEGQAPDGSRRHLDGQLSGQPQAEPGVADAQDVSVSVRTSMHRAGSAEDASSLLDSDCPPHMRVSASDLAPADLLGSRAASRTVSATRPASISSRDGERPINRLLEVAAAHDAAASALGKTGSMRYRATIGRGVFIPLRSSNSNAKELDDTRDDAGSQQISRRPTLDNPEFDVTLGDAAQTVAFLKGINLVDPHDIEDCEDLLETYLKQVEGPLSRLNILQERVDATEALVAMSLNHRRNELVAFDLMLTILTVAIAFVSMVASIMGMNLYWIWVNTPLWVFMLACFGSIFVAITFIMGAIYYARLKGLLFIPSPSSKAMLAAGHV